MFEKQSPVARFLKLALLLSIGVLASGCHRYAGEVSGHDASPLSADSLIRRWQGLSEGVTDAPREPLSLDRTISEALRASPELDQIRQRLNAAAEQVRQAEAAFYPRLILGEAYNVTDNPVFALMNIINQRRLTSGIDFNNPGQQQNFETTLSGQWSLFEGGSRFYDRQAARYRQNSQAANLSAARNLLVAKVTETYYHWLQALDFVKVAERSLEAARTNERLGVARFQAEMALPSEIARLRARTAEVRGNLVTARTAARRFQAAVERLVARPIGYEEIPSSYPADRPVLSEPTVYETDSLLRHALDKRPELAAVRDLIRAARQSIRSAQGGLWPTLRTRAQYQWDSEDLDDHAESWLAGVQADWVIFEGGITLSKIREARVRLKEIEARGTEIALDIALEVHQAVLASREADEKIRVAVGRKKWAQKALEEVQNLYRNQVVTVDALLQSEVSWNQAEASYTAAVFDGRIAHAMLSKALGDFADWMEAENG
jgi:outer membrane protein TolC